MAAVVTLSGATPAFAGWTPSPSAGAATNTSSATTACADQLTSMPGGPGGSTWTPTATDVRGPYVLESLVSGSMSATCLTGPSVTSVSFGGGGSLSSSRAADGGDHGGTSSTTNYAPRRAVRELTLSSLTTRTGAPFDTVEGAVEADVTAVSFELSDGQTITTTVSGGLVLAWWPKREQARLCPGDDLLGDHLAGARDVRPRARGDRPRQPRTRSARITTHHQVFGARVHSERFLNRTVGRRTVTFGEAAETLVERFVVPFGW